MKVNNNASIRKSIQDLQSVNGRPIYEDVNPSSSFKTFLDIYKKLYNKILPLQTRKNSKQNPWFTKDLNTMRKVRDEKKIKVTQGILDEKDYKNYKDTTRQMMRKAQEEYYKDLYDKKQNGMNKMWNI